MMMAVLWYSAVDTMLSNVQAYGGWFSISTSVIGVIALTLALLYMVSKIFSVPTLDKKIKEEFFQLGATFMLLLIMVSMEVTEGLFLGTNKHIEDLMSSMSGYYIVGEDTFPVNPFNIVYVYLISSMDCLKEDFTDSANKVSEKETWLYFTVSATVLSAPVPIPIRTIMVGLGVWDDILNHYVKAEENMWLAIAGYFQINLLQWIESSMFGIYLPLGILLRSIPFTRGGGAGIMAIAITSYFFYPFFLALFYFNGPQLPSSCNVEMRVEPDEVPDEQKKCPLDPTAVLSLIEGDDESNADTGPSIPVLDVSGMNRIRLYTFYYPFLALLICLIIVRSIAQILGGNIADIGRGMVRVI
jgi:hypothetical protein